MFFWKSGLKITSLKCLWVFYVSTLVFEVYALKNQSKNSIVLNIDHPEFRQMLVGLPKFATVAPERVPEWALLGSDHLDQYLRLAGYFQILDSRSYQGIWPEKNFDWQSSLVQSVKKMDRSGWKQLGLESLIFGKVSRLSDQIISLELTFTELRGATATTIAKEYQVRSEYQLKNTLKSFVDEILVRLSGKPGIFSTKIVFVGKKTAKSQKAIYICDIDGGNIEKLTKKESIHLSPSWHPQGKSILFTSYERGNPDLFEMTLPARVKSIISGEKGLNSGGAYSPDGKSIVFSGSSGHGNTDLYVKSNGNARRKKLIAGHGLDVNPVFAPNKKWVAFVSGRYGNPHIFRADLEWDIDGTGFRVVGDRRLTFAGWYNASPAWSPDSELIAFAGFDRNVGRFDLFTMHGDGSKMERLTLRQGDNESPSWSPNGQLLVFSSNRIGNSNRKGQFQIYIMRRDGSHEQKLDLGMYSADSPKWSPVLSWD